MQIMCPLNASSLESGIDQERLHSATIPLFDIFSTDLWQQEKTGNLRGKRISIWKCCSDCRAHHHSDWYSLITLLVLLC